MGRQVSRRRKTWGSRTDYLPPPGGSFELSSDLLPTSLLGLSVAFPITWGTDPLGVSSLLLGFPSLTHSILLSGSGIPRGGSILFSSTSKDQVQPAHPPSPRGPPPHHPGDCLVLRFQCHGRGHGRSALGQASGSPTQEPPVPERERPVCQCF